MRVINATEFVLTAVLFLFLSLSSSFATGQDDPMTRPIKKSHSEAHQQLTSTEKDERKAHAEAARERVYQRWLDQDVRWIITDQERADFGSLTTEKQRDEFVEAFWDRRNPTPQSPENPYKEEHYRRIAYTNTHFAARVPGYRTDRGRFYIMYGPPDSIDSKSDFTPPSETWHYLFVEGIGRNVVLRFTDKCICGEYQLSGADSDKLAPNVVDPLRK